MSKSYDGNSIVKLTDREHMRTNPGMLLGIGQDGILQSIYEAVSNSVDEFLNGHAKNIKIETIGDCHFRITDDGRGIPVAVNQKEGISALELAVGHLRAGGKSKAQEEKSYKTSGGTYGIGISAVNFVSEYFKATSYREGYEWFLEYRDGEKVGELTKGNPTKKTGTSIEFKIDKKIMRLDEQFDEKSLEELIEMTSYLNNGLSLSIDDKTFKSKNGLKDKVDKDVLSKTTSIFHTKKTDSLTDIEVEIAFCWSSGKTKIGSYANGLKTPSGGTHETQFKTTLTREFNKIAKEKKLLKDGESLSGENLRVGLVAEISATGSGFDLAGQTKDKLLTKEAGTAVNRILLEVLNSISEPQLKKILSNARVQAKADAAAEKARAIALGLKEDKKKKKNNPFDNSSKLMDCYGKKRDLCELIITEGDSAASGLANIRNSQTQALLPLRGKILNSQRSGLKSLENKEVQALFKALGCGILNDYKKKDLRYGKIIIATDSDSDGFHIQVLLLTLLKNYLLNLVEDGFVYLAVPPKYEAVDKKGSIVFIKDDEELKKLKNKVSSPHALKGLGSMDPKALYQSTLDPENRTLVQVSGENIDLFIEKIEQMMGKNISFRKELSLSLKVS